jgi:hypothetical protein
MFPHRDTSTFLRYGLWRVATLGVHALGDRVPEEDRPPRQQRGRQHLRAAVQDQTLEREGSASLRGATPPVGALQRVVDLKLQRVSDGGVDLSVRDDDLCRVAEDPVAAAAAL